MAETGIHMDQHTYPNAIPINRKSGSGLAAIKPIVKSNYSPLKYIYLITLLITYKIFLDFSYVQISEVFEYQGLFLESTTFDSYIISWILFFLFCPLFLKALTENTASGNVVSLLTVTSVLPCIAVIGHRSDYPNIYNVLLMTFWLIFYVSWLRIKKIHIKSYTAFQSELFVNIVLFSLCFSVFLYSYINVGIRFQFDLIEVYDIRAEARNFIAPFPLNYLVSFADNILPFFVILMLYKRKYFLSALILFVIYVNFSIAGTKQIIFTLLFGLLGYISIQKTDLSYRFLIGGIFLLMVGYVENVFFQQNVVNTLFPYRVLFIPAELHFSYYSYFQDNEILLFSQSILKWLQADTNIENIQFLIGEYSIGEFSARANNGLFSDAYMNLGIIGVIVYPVIIATFLRIIDGAVEGLPERILFVVIIYISFVLLGMTLTSAFLTSGLLFLVLFLYSLPRQTLEQYS
jgi:hypothetical protein